MFSRDADEASKPTCLLSFDVEAHCQIEAAYGMVDPADWRAMSGRIERNVNWLLDRLAAHEARATFFMLGWVARHRPWVVRRIAEAGHELACHGYAHDRLHRLDPRKLAADLSAARAAIEDQAQQVLRGYRAPSFSLTTETSWAVDVIAEQGFTYDSSVQPVRHPSYGVPDAPRWPYHLVGRSGVTLAELPPLTWQVGSMRLPVAGGGYFRLFPPALMHAGIRAAAKQGRPAALYFHPWEFDADQPRLPLNARQRIRTYVGIGRSRARLERLLNTTRGIGYGEWFTATDAADWPTYQLPELARQPATHDRSSFDRLVELSEPALADSQRRGARQAA